MNEDMEWQESDELEELAPGVILTWISGMCPVQADGTVNGQPFYFRARHDTVSLGIGGGDVVMRPDWEWCELYDAVYSEEAGYITHDQARVFIIRFARKYQQGVPGNGPEYHAQHRRLHMLRMKQERPEWYAALSAATKAEIEALAANTSDEEAQRIARALGQVVR